MRGAALVGKAGEALQQTSGIESGSLASLGYGWRQGCDPLVPRGVLVIDEAGMVGDRRLGRLPEAAQEAGAKVVLASDSRQLQPSEAGAAFRCRRACRRRRDRRSAAAARGLRPQSQ